MGSPLQVRVKPLLRPRAPRRLPETEGPTFKSPWPFAGLVPLPKGLKVVLFDFDQTLIHLGADWEGLRLQVKGIATKYGVPFDEKWVLRGIGQAYKSLVDAGKPHEADAFKNEAFKVVEDTENAALDSSHAIDKAPDVVAELMRRGYKVAIVSNNNPRSIAEGLRRFGFPEVLLVVGRHNGDPVKPSPIPVHKALSKLGSKPGEAVIIGDGEADVGAGKAAGVATILFAPAGHVKETPTKPTERVDHLSALLAMLPPIENGHSVH
jgi:HAD superfamily hydrolase (TIGR01662 family)